MDTLLVSDSLLLKSAINSLLEKSTRVKNIRVVESYCHINEDISKDQILFVAMKNITIEFIKRLQELKENANNLRVVIIDVNKNNEVLVNAVMNRLDGYISDIENEYEFNYIINAMIKGKKFYDSQSIDDLFLSYAKYNNSNVVQGLTNREQEVIISISKGYNNKEIAKRLYITEYTVKKHITNILNKLNLRNRKEIIIYVKDNYTEKDLCIAQ